MLYVVSVIVLSVNASMPTTHPVIVTQTHSHLHTLNTDTTEFLIEKSNYYYYYFISMSSQIRGNSNVNLYYV